MKTRDMAELLLLAAIWGGSFLFLRQASPAIGSLGVAGWRVTGGALVLLPLVILHREGPALWRHRRPLIGAALLSSILPFAGLSQAARELPAGLLSILNATTPMWGALVGWVWAREPLSIRRAAGLLLGLLGVALLAADTHQFATTGRLWAAGLALGSTLMYAFAVHYNKRCLSELSPLANSGGTLGMASALLFLPVLWWGPQPAETAAIHPATWAAVPWSVWGAVAMLAVACTGLAYLVFYRLIERVGASRALTVTFLIPVFGMLWGALFLGERITPAMVLGTSVILAGTWLSNQVASSPGQNPPRDA